MKLQDLLNERNNISITISLNDLKEFVDVIVNKVTENVLSATVKREPRFYSRAETAALLHITLPTLARITKDGFIASKRVGSRVLYEANAIDEAVNKGINYKYYHHVQAT